VEQRRYRFRFLNGSNGRFLILKFDNDLPFWQIGTEGGFLPEPVRLEQLLMGPAERADVIVDFTTIPTGTEIILLNLGPDEPFGGGTPGEDFEPANPATTGQVMQLRVTPSRHRDTSLPPERLRLPKLRPLGGESITRQVSLNEADSATVRTTGEPPVFDCDFGEVFGPVEARLGTMNGAPNPLGRADEITENPAVGRLRSGRCTTSQRTPTRSTSTRFSSRSSTGSPSTVLPTDPRLGRRASRTIPLALAPI